MQAARGNARGPRLMSPGTGAVCTPTQCLPRLGHYHEACMMQPSCSGRQERRWGGLAPQPTATGRLRAARASSYDNPALYEAEDAFSLASYWDRRYKSDPNAFEWYRGYESLEPLLKRHLDIDQPVLHVGVGTSRLQYQMHLDGYRHIHNVDYSEVCIRQLRELHAGVEGLTYDVADCRTMPQLADGSFASVLDKGTIDALLCGDSDREDSLRMLQECQRVLRPGGVYVCITYSPPKVRLPYLARLAEGLPAWASVAFYEVGQQGRVEGPMSVPIEAAGDSDDASWAAYPKQPYSHFLYVCTKA